MKRRNKLKVKGIVYYIKGAVRSFLNYTLNYIYMAVIIALVLKYI